MKETIESHQAKQRMAADEEAEDDLPLTDFRRLTTKPVRPNRPDAIPKRGQTRQQANEQRAESERMAKQRADEAAHTAAALADRQRRMDNAVNRQKKGPPKLTKRQQAAIEKDRQAMKAGVSARKKK